MKKIKFWPTTKMGRYSALAVFIFVLAIAYRIVQGETGLFQSRLADLMEIFAFFLEYLAGGIGWLFGIISILRYKERSLLVIAYTLLPFAALGVIFIRSMLS